VLPERLGNTGQYRAGWRHHSVRNRKCFSKLEILMTSSGESSWSILFLLSPGRNLQLLTDLQ